MDITALRRFYNGFFIDTPQGNNAFAYAQRRNKKIYVAPLICGGMDDVRPGREIVFSDIVDGVEINAAGLERLVHVACSGREVFIMDNHNHAFSFWAAGVASGAIQPGSMLVHVDQHKDTRNPPVRFSDGTQDAFRYANEVLDVGNFIPPAVELGWFDQVVQVGSAEAFSCVPQRPFVLDIDLDIFAPVMDYIPHSLKMDRLRRWMGEASFVTMATSPFFMHQEKAVALARQILSF